MRHYTLETKKLKHQIEHSLVYRAYPHPAINFYMITGQDGRTSIQSDMFAADGVLEKILESNLRLIRDLPLSTSIKTEVNLH